MCGAVASVLNRIRARISSSRFYRYATEQFVSNWSSIGNILRNAISNTGVSIASPPEQDCCTNRDIHSNAVVQASADFATDIEALETLLGDLTDDKDQAQAKNEPDKKLKQPNRGPEAATATSRTRSNTGGSQSNVDNFKVGQAVQLVNLKSEKLNGTFGIVKDGITSEGRVGITTLPSGSIKVTSTATMAIKYENLQRPALADITAKLNSCIAQANAANTLDEPSPELYAQVEWHFLIQEASKKDKAGRKSR